MSKKGVGGDQGDLTDIKSHSCRSSLDYMGHEFAPEFPIKIWTDFEFSIYFLKFVFIWFSKVSSSYIITQFSMPESMDAQVSHLASHLAFHLGHSGGRDQFMEKFVTQKWASRILFLDNSITLFALCFTKKS